MSNLTNLKMMMMIKDRSNVKPLLVKFGVVLALSFAGFLYSRIRTKKIKPPPPPNSGSDNSHKTVDHNERLKVNDDPQTEIDSPDAYDKQCIKVRVDSSSVHASPNGKYSEDKDGYLLPEFDQVVKEVNVANSFKDLPKSLKRVERDDYEQEIEILKKRIRFLVQRERKLEVQLLEYYGLREQENVVRELQNRLKINSIEAKLFLMKIENLKAENKRLEAQVADYSKVVSELEAAKAKIKQLRRKIRYDAQHNKEQILDLTQRVVKLHEQEQGQEQGQEQEQDQEQDQEQEVSTSNSEDPTELLQRLTELEAEAEELKKCNEKLQQENADLAHRLESTQVLANSLFEDPEKEESHKTMVQLREENEKLTKEVERLQVDKCGEVEELVYLRWINACLRYELRNYQAPPGKTVARDLSKCLSPTSEQKAKQLILEYANSEDVTEKESLTLMDVDFDQWPSSQPSYLTDSTDHDEYPGTSSSHKPHSKRTSFFSALRKIVRGLSIHHHNHSYNQTSRSSSMSRSLSVDNIGKRYAEAGHNVSRSNPQSPRLALSSQYSNNSSSDLHHLASLAEEDENVSRVNNMRSSSSNGGVKFLLGRETAGDSSPLGYTPEPESEYGQRSELAKYAEVFRESSWLPIHKKSASFSALHYVNSR